MSLSEFNRIIINLFDKYLIIQCFTSPATLLDPSREEDGTASPTLIPVRFAAAYGGQKQRN